jgi:hypothetical protein
VRIAANSLRVASIAFCIFVFGVLVDVVDRSLMLPSLQGRGAAPARVADERADRFAEDDARMLPGTFMSKTMIGKSLSMQSVSAVLSITSRPRCSTSR